VVFASLAHSVKKAMYYDGDCLKKIEILFWLIWILISKYFGIILDKNSNLYKIGPKNEEKARV